MYIALPLPPRPVSKTEMEPKLNGMDWFKGKQIIANHGLVTSYKGFLDISPPIHLHNYLNVLLFLHTCQ